MEQGFAIACGDRRGFVAFDADGKVWSLSRWCGVAAKEMRQRLGPGMDLPFVQDSSETARTLPKRPVDPRHVVFEARRTKLIAAQRDERDILLKAQETQRHLDIIARQASLPKGLRSLLARARGNIGPKSKSLKLRQRSLRIETAPHSNPSLSSTWNNDKN